MRYLITVKSSCPECWGSGVDRGERCPSCKGRAPVKVHRRFEAGDLARARMTCRRIIQDEPSPQRVWERAMIQVGDMGEAGGEVPLGGDRLLTVEAVPYAPIGDLTPEAVASMAAGLEKELEAADVVVAQLVGEDLPARLDASVVRDGLTFTWTYPQEKGFRTVDAARVYVDNVLIVDKPLGGTVMSAGDSLALHLLG